MGLLSSLFGKKAATVTVPNAQETIKASQEANAQAQIDSARLSAVDQYNPFGSTTFQRNADGTPYAQTTEYSPQLMDYINRTFDTASASNDYQQAQYGAGQDYLSSVYPSSLQTDLNSQALMNQRYGVASDIIGRLPTTNLSVDDTSQIADTSYRNQIAQMAPDIARTKSQMSTDLQNRGIPVGSEIYNDEMNRLNTAENNAYLNASQQAQLAAGQEQTRQLGVNQTLQMSPYNELNAIGAGTYQAQNPNYAATSATYTAPEAIDWGQQTQQPADVTGAYQLESNANQFNANAKNTANNSFFSGLLGLGKAGLGLLG